MGRKMRNIPRNLREEDRAISDISRTEARARLGISRLFINLTIVMCIFIFVEGNTERYNPTKKCQKWTTGALRGNGTKQHSYAGEEDWWGHYPYIRWRSNGGCMCLTLILRIIPKRNKYKSGDFL